MRVSSHNGVRINNILIILKNDSSEILQIDLMYDTTSGRDDGEVVKSSGSPFQEFKSFVVSIELNLFILFPGIYDSGLINLNTVINDQIYRTKRVDFLRIASQSSHCASHGCQVYNCRDSCEILENDSGRFESYFNLLASKFFPAENALDILGSDFELIAVSDCTFEEDSDTEG